MFLLSRFDTVPTVAKQFSFTFFISPEFNFIIALPPSIANKLPDDHADLAICAPLPGFNSTLCKTVPTGMFFNGIEFPILISTLSPD